MKKAVFNWSGGKDSALALQKVLEEKEFEVIALLTTKNKELEVRVPILSSSSKQKTLNWNEI
ncbi:Dph6-related ATP pyrophosphatase [Kaistella gelatinilytica]|uniref:Dph6-related ATP pyrophosphatase n=1 Tax=Kaistella gelatinilytica TaxID=2787636 RepID=UPI00293D4C2F|nr:hypothetical protein [Kaistella gelatinilytica]